VPVLIELARRIDAGQLSWDSTLRVENSFISIADSQPYSLDPADDSDSTLYALVGTDVKLQELARLMTVRSSNLATNNIVRLLGAERITATAHALGADSVLVLRGVEDIPAFRRGMNNTLTARGLAKLFEALLAGRAASANGTQRILGFLAGQEFNGGIPAGLPAGTLMAHKTGSQTAVHHDAGIVYPAGAPPYILVVLTRGYATEPEAEAVMARIATEAHAIAIRH
jgi:beta-lactamase class A